MKCNICGNEMTKITIENNAIEICLSCLEEQDTVRAGVDYAVPVMRGNGELLNEHGKYVLKYAKNHGISVHDAHNAPMVKAHLAYFSHPESHYNKCYDTMRYAT